MTEEIYTWQDDAIEAGAVCDTDKTNENIMHLKYTHKYPVNATYDGTTHTLNMGEITDLPCDFPNGNYISNIKMQNGDILEIGGEQFDSEWTPVETQGDNVYDGDVGSNTTNNFITNLYQFSLENLLPNDGYSYDCLFTFYLETLAVANNTQWLRAVNGDYIDNWSSTPMYQPIKYIDTVTASKQYGSCNIILNIPANQRTLYLWAYAIKANIKIGLQAYKRLGTNNYNNTNYLANINNKPIGGINMPGSYYMLPDIVTLINAVNLAADSTTIVDLSEYIPVDDFQYEAIFDIEARTVATAGRGFDLTIDTGNITGLKTLSHITRTNSYETDACQFKIPLFANQRQITIKNNSSYAANNTILKLIGFRRLARES